MLIDVHTHLVGVDPDNGCYVARSMRRGLLFQYLKRTLGLGGVPEERLDDAYREKLVGWAEDSELDAVGVLALDGVYGRDGQLDRDRTSVLISNDYCLEVCRDADGLLPICSVNPNRSDALEELDRVVEAGSVAIKLLPNSQDIDPADPAHLSFWQRMSELGVPLLTHTSFEHTIPVINQEWGHPRRLTPALDEGVTVIAAHCASAGVMHLTEHFDTWLDMIRTYPNLYGDISAMASMARFSYIRRVLEDDVARERVMLGSDFPIPVSPWLFLNTVGWSEMTRLTGIENPLQKNLETFRTLGCGQSILRRGQRVLRV
jgi:hypothetical protein